MISKNKMKSTSIGQAAITIPPAKSLAEIFQPIEVDLEQVRDTYLTILSNVAELNPWNVSGKTTQSLINFLKNSSFSPVAIEMGRYLSEQHGKWLRPALVLLSANTFGSPQNGLIEIATSMELIHTATLLHDDVIDQACTRRGMPTVAKQFGNSMSILMGDLLYTKAYTLLSDYGNIECQRQLSRATQEVCLGEITQNQGVQNIDYSEEWYLAVVEAKTASLMSACLKLGAVMAQASEASMEKIGEFGIAFGIAFQVQDDVLDLTASDSQLGKDVGNDILNGKWTLPIIHYVCTKGNSFLINIKDEVDPDIRSAKFKQLVASVKENGSLDYARQVAASYAARAESILDQLDGSVVNSQCRTSLRDLTHFIIQRDL